MRKRFLIALLSMAAAAHVCAQQAANGEVRAKLVGQSAALRHPVPAAVWLSPAPGTPAIPFVAHGAYTLMQKNRMFQPHLQVVPVGAVVQFPNADPFFHNVFSLFDGKRFDLGLYEAGSTKSVTFSREGVSYIFCNIHPEMSAVILTLSSPLYTTGRTGDVLTIRGVAPGEYDLKVWVEGAQQASLERLQRRIRVSSGRVEDVGEIGVHVAAAGETHNDKFGHPYEPEPRSIY